MRKDRRKDTGANIGDVLDQAYAKSHEPNPSKYLLYGFTLPIPQAQDEKQVQRISFDVLKGGKTFKDQPYMDAQCAQGPWYQPGTKASDVITILKAGSFGKARLWPCTADKDYAKIRYPLLIEPNRQSDWICSHCGRFSQLRESTIRKKGHDIKKALGHKKYNSRTDSYIIFCDSCFQKEVKGESLQKKQLRKLKMKHQMKLHGYTDETVDSNNQLVQEMARVLARTEETSVWENLLELPQIYVLFQQEAELPVAWEPETELECELVRRQAVLKTRPVPLHMIQNQCSDGVRVRYDEVTNHRFVIPKWTKACPGIIGVCMTGKPVNVGWIPYEALSTTQSDRSAKGDKSHSSWVRQLPFWKAGAYETIEV